MEDSHKTPGAIDPVLYSANELYNVRLKTKQTNKNTTHPLRKKKTTNLKAPVFYYIKHANTCKSQRGGG